MYTCPGGAICSVRGALLLKPNKVGLVDTHDQLDAYGHEEKNRNIHRPEPFSRSHPMRRLVAVTADIPRLLSFFLRKPPGKSICFEEIVAAGISEDLRLLRRLQTHKDAERKKRGTEDRTSADTQGAPTS